MNIKPGQSIKISEISGIVCTMERSGKGDVIRYIADKTGTIYAVAFDADGVVDTIKASGKLISADKPKAQTILKHAAPIHCGVLPDRMAKAGWTWPKRT